MKKICSVPNTFHLSGLWTKPIFQSTTEEPCDNTLTHTCHRVVISQNIIDFDDDQSRIEMSILGTITLDQFEDYNDATIEVIRETILKSARGGLDQETQRVTDVLFESIDKDGVVTYELVLEELCEESCIDQAQDGVMYNAVTDSMYEQLEDGSLTNTLRAFARRCDDKDCNGIQEAIVEDISFDDEVLVTILVSVKSLKHSLVKVTQDRTLILMLLLFCFFRVQQTLQHSAQ